MTHPRNIVPAESARDRAWHLQRQLRAREADLRGLRAARDAEIAAALEAGTSRRELAELLELSYQAIAKIERTV